jgi:L-ribulose-5-phosphate 4-epimerase
MKKYHCSKERVLKSNIKIHKKGLVFQNFGNASGRKDNLCLIKPSGVNISKLEPNLIVSVNLQNIQLLESGQLKPSSDTPTHVQIYNTFDEVGGVVHTHSPFATAWAQSGLSIPCYGTTHADYWQSNIPITRQLNDNEIKNCYEKNIGKVIIETLLKKSLTPLNCPGVLVHGHGPFTWGSTVEEAVKYAELIEYISKEAYLSLNINSNIKTISDTLAERHFNRKHGLKSYYGQEIDEIS